MKEIRINTFKLKQDVAKLENLQKSLNIEQVESENISKGKVPEQVQATEDKLFTTSNHLANLIFQTKLTLNNIQEGIEEVDQTAARALESTQ